ncbi:WXG100 family type VII secretion target [Arthrobacter sp. CDRTa11]|uniref:WXG100 family type VII secretion target n=1 Tax=Arthrobacter sp. CDRTa11 TaxID=2651199 RepID=UPI002265A268|nr:WXG100 family type VII secretion target [Arthrobacter sp. CDRTa11]UZX04189.1 WXG100 family type VII secretion target [Arthrobacter sp. CDRTa11]
MAGNLWGADVAQLRMLAQQFGTASESLMQQSSSLTGAINNGSGSWKGADSARFRSEWNGSHRALIQQTADALKQESKRLLANADDQEKESNAAPGSGGGPGGGGSSSPNGPGGSSTPFDPWGPDWISDGDSPFRSGWDAYNGVLGLKTVPLGLRDFSQFAARHGDEVNALFGAGHDLAAWKRIFNKDLWEAAARSDGLRGAFSGTADLLSGKFGDFAEMARGAGAADLGPWAKFGLNSAGHALGGISVGLDGLDTVNAIREGETGDALKSGLKTALGVGSFFPPPVGVTCMVIGGAWAAVELIPGAKDSIDNAFDAVGDFTEDAAENIGEGVKDFFGF